MGYESKIIVVSKSCLQDEETGLFWAEKIAEINLSRVGNDVLTGIHEHGKYTDCYFEYLPESCTPSNIDKYGDVIKELTLDDMITILKEAINNSDYRRYPPCLAMLESFKKAEVFGQWSDLVVLHYGY